MDKIKYILMCMLLLAFLTGCGDQNFFEWSHKEGSNKSVASLNADADKSFRDGNYGKAGEYYSEVLEKDSKNSEALYGMAKVAYAINDIKLAKLASSFLEDIDDDNDSQNSSSFAFTDLDLCGSFNAGGGSSKSDLIPSSIIKEKLLAATIVVIDALSRIANNQADNVIAWDDPDVNINLAIALVINSALLILDSNGDGYPGDAGDLIEVNQDFTVTVDESEFDALKSDSGKMTLLAKRIVKAIFQIIGKYENLNDLGIITNKKGALDYLVVAINSPDIPENGILNDIKQSLVDFYKKDDIGIDLKELYEDTGIDLIGFDVDKYNLYEGGNV